MQHLQYFFFENTWLKTFIIFVYSVDLNSIVKLNIMKLSSLKQRTVSVLLILTVFIFSASGQADTTYWKRTGQATLNLSQVSLSNWVGGGKSSASGISRFDYNAIYEKDRMQWDNTIKAGYGLLKEEGSSVIKNEDILELNSKLGYRLNENNLFYSSFLNFTTQFAPGYRYPDTSNKISDILAPAYITIATGIDYQPSESFSIFFTPLSAKFTIVADDSLSNAGAFGVEPGETFRAEMGATAKFEYKATIMPNVDLNTDLSLFSNYFDQFENVDVNWDVILNMKINTFLSASFSTTLIYDHDILIPVDDQGNMGRRVQLKQVLGVGFSYRF